jgi:predicted dehydrogenase
VKERRLSSTLGVGVIGCGVIATTAHLPAWRRLAHRARIVGVADVREEVARRTAHEFGADFWTTDFRRLIERPEIQAVDVCTPEFLHREQAEAALLAGKHVLCEKPMANSLEEADAMIAASERSGAKLMIGHSRRFTRRYKALKTYVASGTIGQVRLVRELERRPRTMLSSRGLELWKPDGERPWGSDPRYSKGIALRAAIHELDLFQWYLSDRPRRIFAQTMNNNRRESLPTHLVYQVRFHNGGMAYSDQSAHQPPEYPFFHQIEIYGTKGILRANDTGSLTCSLFHDGRLELIGTFEALLHDDGTYVAEIEHFLDCIEHDQPMSIAPAEARSALAMALALVDSIELGEAIDLETGR